MDHDDAHVRVIQRRARRQDDGLRSIAAQAGAQFAVVETIGGTKGSAGPGAHSRARAPRNTAERGVPVGCPAGIAGVSNYLRCLTKLNREIALAVGVAFRMRITVTQAFDDRRERWRSAIID